MTDTRTRGSRIEEVAQVRRRRDDATIDGGQALNLPVPPAIAERLTAEGRTWRWANDVGDRMHRLTVRDDWDRVEGVEPVEVTIDRNKGTTCKAILLSKPKAFLEEDQQRREAARLTQEQNLLEGKIPNAPSTPTGMYVARGSKLGRANQLIE